MDKFLLWRYKMTHHVKSTLTNTTSTTQTAQFEANHPHIASALSTHTPPTAQQIAQFETSHPQIELTGTNHHVPAVPAIA